MGTRGRRAAERLSKDLNFPARTPGLPRLAQSILKLGAGGVPALFRPAAFGAALRRGVRASACLTWRAIPGLSLPATPQFPARPLARARATLVGGAQVRAGGGGAGGGAWAAGEGRGWARPGPPPASLSPPRAPRVPWRVVPFPPGGRPAGWPVQARTTLPRRRRGAASEAGGGDRAGRGVPGSGLVPVPSPRPRPQVLAEVARRDPPGRLWAWKPAGTRRASLIHFPQPPLSASHVPWADGGDEKGAVFPRGRGRGNPTRNGRGRGSCRAWVGQSSCQAPARPHVFRPRSRLPQP